MIEIYPNSINEIPQWSKENGMTIGESRQRFAQYATLCGISSIPSLRESIVFKGGNALDFIWHPNRSTIDLDFSFDMDNLLFEPTIESIGTFMSRSLAISTSQFGIGYSITSVKQQPPGEDKTFITYIIRIAYALPDEPRLLLRLTNKQGSLHMLPIEISMNEPIVQSTRAKIGDNFPKLRVCTVEDIIGEKLRSILQQPIRKRNRRQDILDVAVIVQDNPDLNLEHIANCLEIKASARSVPVSKAAFRDIEIRNRAVLDYAELQQTTRTIFIPFNDAFEIVLGFIDRLAIPD